MSKTAEKSQTKVSPSERTPEQRFADIRRNLAGKLAVTPDDQRFLLAEYDALQEQHQGLRLVLDVAIKNAPLAPDAPTLAKAAIDDLAMDGFGI